MPHADHADPSVAVHSAVLPLGEMYRMLLFFPALELITILPSKYHLFNFTANLETESTRKLSNFNSQWTKTLYQNIAFFLTFFKAPKDVISHL